MQHNNGDDSGSIEVDDTAGYQKLVSPVSAGPGEWFTLHTLGAYSDTFERKIFFCDFVNYFVRNILCEKCRGHATTYVETHPITDAKYWNYVDNRGRQLGMFRWTFDFHNTVNQRLNKKIFSWEDAIAIFVEKNFLEKQYERAMAEGGEIQACSAGCEEKGETTQESTPRVSNVAAPEELATWLNRSMTGAPVQAAARSSSSYSHTAPSVIPSKRFPNPLGNGNTTFNTLGGPVFMKRT